MLKLSINRLGLGLAIALTLITLNLAAANPAPPPTATLKITTQQTFGAASTASFTDLAPALAITWDYVFTENGNSVVLTATHSGDPLPPNTELAIVTLTDPDTGHEEAYLVGTTGGGGATLIVMSDL